MSFLEDISTYLSNQSISCYIGSMPADPDAVVVLYARPGRPKDLYCDLQYPELHVEVRAATYTAAQSKAESVDALLHALHDQDLSGHRYLEIQALGVPAKLEEDGRRRTIFYQNFRIIKGA